MTKKAISVIDEAANAYWDAIESGAVRTKFLSIHTLREIFNEAVIPAINRARELDREKNQGCPKGEDNG